MKKYISMCLILYVLSCNAQNWQWAKAGGGVDDNPLTTGPWESYMNDMAVDKWGNVYAVGSTFNDIQFTGTSDTFPYYGGVNAFIVKWDKCGNFQWAIVNGSAGDAEYYAITIDSDGYIYVGGVGYSDNVTAMHIQTSLHSDTLIYNTQMIFTKYDPNGNLVWLQGANQNWTALWHSMKLRSDGKLVALMDCGTGGTWQSLTAPSVTTGIDYVLALLDTQNGNLLQSTLMDTLPNGIASGIISSPFVLDGNDNIYLPVNAYNLTSSGQSVPATFFAQAITLPPYAAMIFKVDKNLNLVKYAYDDNSDAILSISYSEGALYSAGGEYSNSNYLGDTVGSLTTITAGGSGNVYRVYKLDTGTLAPVWESSPQFEDASPNEIYVATTSKHVWMSASTYGLTVWDGDSINVLGANQEQFLFKFDKETGHCDTIYVDSGETSQSNVTSMIMADPQENLLIGGQFADQFTCGPNTLVPWGGSESPIFFIEKWGIDCSDSINTNDNPYPPANLLTTTGGVHSINLQWNDNSSYRISFHIYRSLDGVSNWQLVDTVLSAQTILSDTGLTPNTWYWYKVAAWNIAGESDYTNIDSAKTDTITGIENVALNNWALYPNPAKDQLTLIASANNTQVVTIELNDVTGNEVMNQTYSLTAGTNMHYIDISQLPAGYYEVSIISNGLKTTKPVVKF